MSFTTYDRPTNRQWLSEKKRRLGKTRQFLKCSRYITLNYKGLWFVLAGLCVITMSIVFSDSRADSCRWDTYVVLWTMAITFVRVFAKTADITMGKLSWRRGEHLYNLNM